MESATIKVGRIQIGNKWRIVVDPTSENLIIQYSNDNFVNVTEVVTFPQQPTKDPIKDPYPVE
jgi:hypothetical protein